MRGVMVCDVAVIFVMLRWLCWLLVFVLVCFLGLFYVVYSYCL